MDTTTLLIIILIILLVGGGGYYGRAAGSKPLRGRRLEADALVFRPALISCRDRDEGD
jgi:hypothetical protein